MTPVNFWGDYTATITLEEVNRAVEISSNIPPDAKMAVKDFIEDNFEGILENIDSLTDLEVPQEIIDSLPHIIEIFKTLGGG